MGNHTVVGELGAGKTKLSVAYCRIFLEAGKKVASNVDMYLEYLLPPLSKSTYRRLTDFPQQEELESLGQGGSSPIESSFGLLFLDELAMFLNARSWQKEGREDFIIFQRHLRKKRWHTLFLAQDIESIDKQARNALVERVVVCGRTDRVRIPVFGRTMQFFGLSGMRPQKHIGYIYYGKKVGPNAKYQDKWEHSGQDLNKAYNTEQEFTPLHFEKHIINGQEVEIPIGRQEFWPIGTLHQRQRKKLVDDDGQLIFYDDNGKPQYTEVDVVGQYSVLSAWHLHGRYLNHYQLNKARYNVFFFFIAFIYGVFTLISLPKIERSSESLRCKTPDSYIVNGGRVAIHDNGHVLKALLINGKAYVNSTTCYKVNQNDK